MKGMLHRRDFGEDISRMGCPVHDVPWIGCSGDDMFHGWDVPQLECSANVMFRESTFCRSQRFAVGMFNGWWML